MRAHRGSGAALPVGEEVTAVRRVAGMLVLAVAVATGCGVRPAEVAGAAAPVTGTGPPPATRSPTPASSPSSSGPTTAPSSPPVTTPPPVPEEYQTLTMRGFGATVRLPVPASWVRKPSSTGGLIRTDVDLEDPQVLLRIDLSARGSGSAADGAVRNEAGAALPGYRRLAITPVAGVGDDAADWTFTFVRDGLRRVVDRQILAGTAGIAVYYSAPDPLYQRYLPVWQRAVEQLTITTS
jgi:eukaryotic-like serine/threonine-protein kinase